MTAVTVYRVEIAGKYGVGSACEALRGPVGIANRRENGVRSDADGKQILTAGIVTGTQLFIKF
jgi:hypothetical protein